MINLLKKFGMLEMTGKIKLDNKKIFLIIVICLVIVYFDFQFLIKLQLKALKGLRPKIVRLKEDLDTLNKDLVKMQDLKNRQIGANQKVASDVKRIISEGEIASLLQDVSDMANKNEIKILQMKPARESPGLKQAIAVAGIEKFTPLLITLDLFCDYHHLGKFLNDLENAKDFIAVQNIKITSQQTDYLKQKASLVLKAYVRK